MNDIEFVDGLRIYAPNESAPDYIIANAQLDRDALTAWLAGREPQIRIVIKRSKGGNLYASVDTYKRDTAAQEPRKPKPAPATDGFEDEALPF
jgi:hypothetical protein